MRQVMFYAAMVGMAGLLAVTAPAKADFAGAKGWFNGFGSNLLGNLL